MPENQPNAKGVFFGAELKHDKGHFVRAIMESVAYMIKEYVDFMGVSLNQIRSMGGGANSKLWCEIKSGVLGKEIVTLKQNETACLGSAIFAGMGIGTYENQTIASEKIVATEKSYKVDNPEYQKIYSEYKIKEKKLMEIFK